MSEVRAFTIDSFYKFIDEGKLMAARCNNCGALHLPPRPVCSKCLSKNLQWVPASSIGKLVTYTVIHVAPKQFESSVPYPVGIVRLQDGPQLLGMIRGVEPNKLKVGMDLAINFEKTSSSQTQWPPWSRYYFKST